MEIGAGSGQEACGRATQNASKIEKVEEKNDGCSAQEAEIEPPAKTRLEPKKPSKGLGGREALLEAGEALEGVLGGGNFKKAVTPRSRGRPWRRLWQALASQRPGRGPASPGRPFWQALASGRLWQALASWQALADSGRLWQALAGSGRQALASLLGRAGSGRLWQVAGSGRLWQALASSGSSGRLWLAGSGRLWQGRLWQALAGSEKPASAGPVLFLGVTRFFVGFKGIIIFMRLYAS